MSFQIFIFIIFIFKNLNKGENIYSLKFKIYLKYILIIKINIFFIYSLYKSIIIKIFR